MAEFAPAPVIDRLRALAGAAWRPRDLAAGDELFALGEPAAELWVLERGLIKLGYLTANGEEWVKSFIVDAGLFTGSGDLSAGASRFGAVALEPCRVVALPLDWLARQLTADAALRDDFSRFSAWLQARKQRREEALLCASAEQRYRDFLAAEPALAVRLLQADLARYIGITPIALSRIRKRLGLSGG
ncbi:MAG: Crp/Fnr family transcriptional regulator [Novosphingobium sp.]